MKIKWVRQSLILIVFIALLVSVTWTYISVQSKPATVPVKEVSLSITPDYRITSRKDLKIWPAGTVFEQGMVSYFYAAQPEVFFTPLIEISGLDQGLINGTITSQIVIQAVNDKAQVYWSYELKEIPEQVFTLSQGVSGQVDQSVFIAKGVLLDVPNVYELVTEISKELMFQTGLFQLLVTSNINVSGTANGIQIEKTTVQDLPLVLQQGSFTIPKSIDAITKIALNQNSSSQTSQQSLLDIVRANLLSISADFGLGVLLLILILKSKATKSKAANEHKRYKEWITEGSVAVTDRLSINIFTLEGLVDLAIDLDKRVIYDSRINKYYVLTEDIVYVHDSECSNAMMDNRQQLGELLVERGLLHSEQLETGLYYQRKIGSRLGESLIALGFIDETTLYSTLAAQHRIDYYELDPKIEITDICWLSKMSIKKARALLALPLGQRADGRLVIACSETSKEGIQKALQEMFGTEIYTVVTRPSAIYEVLERLDTQEKQKLNDITLISGNKVAPFERLSDKEWEQFTASYFRGNIIYGLFLKASGLADPVILAQALEQESIISWLINRNIINGEIGNLMKGLDKSTQAMEWKSKQEKQLPGILDLLLKANYLTSETVEWCNRELTLQGLTIDQLLSRNYLASEGTIKNARLLLGILESVLNKSSIVLITHQLFNLPS